VDWNGKRKRTRTIFDNYSPSFNEEIFYKIPIQGGGLKDKKGELRPEGLKQLAKTLESHNEIYVSVWIDPKNGVFEFIGQAVINLKELNKGVKKTLKFYDRKKKKECEQEIRQVNVQCKLVSGFNKEMNTSVNLELMLFPFLNEQDFTFEEISRKSGTRINPLIQGILEKETDSDNYHQFLTKIVNNFEEEPTLARIVNFRSVFLEDQVGEKNFLSTFLCPVDIKSLQNGKKINSSKSENSNKMTLSDTDLIELNTKHEIFHFVNCLQYQTDLSKKLLLSPDFLMSQNKGDVSDHAVLLTCLFMGLK
jgi:hypothetical protein